MRRATIVHPDSTPPGIQSASVMTTSIGHLPKRNLSYLPLSLEAERLALQLEQALYDPSATEDGFFQALDRYSTVLTSMARQRETSQPALVKH